MRSHPFGARPQRGRGGHHGHPRRRTSHRHDLLPGRTHGILHVHEGLVGRAGRRAHPHLWRRWRHHPVGRNSRVARLRHRTHLPPRRRTGHGVAGHDQRPDPTRGLQHGPQLGRLGRRHHEVGPAQRARLGPVHHGRGEQRRSLRCRLCGRQGQPSRSPRAGHHGHRRRGQIVHGGRTCATVLDRLP